ncbi:MAG: M48 family metalloprotease, partial [Myxococcus sp.]|nr:M48 family metalloprotease [Myxococcus sp.]
MRTLLTTIGCLLLACAPPLAQGVKKTNFAQASLEAQRSAQWMETARRECEASRRRLTPEAEAAQGQQMLTTWLTAGQADGQARVTRADARVAKVGQSLVPHTGKPGVTWTFLVAEAPAVDSFSAPSGTVVVTRGLVEAASADAALAGALAHEMAHLVLRHQLAALETQEHLQCQTRRYSELMVADAQARGVKDATTDAAARLATSAGQGAGPSPRQLLSIRDPDADRQAATWLHAAGIDAVSYTHL